MRICLVQFNPIIGQLEKNLEKTVAFIEQGEREGADLIVFPELSLCGYFPHDFLCDERFIFKMKEMMDLLVQNSAKRKAAIVIGCVRRNKGEGKHLFNSAAFIHQGKILGFYDKSLLPTYDVFDERRYFEPGKGPFVGEVAGKKVGILICEDMWYARKEPTVKAWGKPDEVQEYKRDPVQELADQKPDLVVNLSASPYHFGKPEIRFEVCAKAAQKLGCPLFLCCQVGANDEIVFDGHSLCVDKKGKLITKGKGFEEDLVFADAEAKGKAEIKNGFVDDWKDLYEALVLGVRDYFYKQGFKKAILGLSGGIDSALVSCIAVEALGKKQVTALMMPSRYSSVESSRDAKFLIDQLGIASEVVSIEQPFQSYLEEFAPFFKGKKEDVTEENIQARIRGTILMAFANKFGSILLNTGNKSELAVGYCTLYGDMCGGLAVIGDLLKTQVYTLSRWINASKKREIIPCSILEKAPSAELRHGQKDTDSLPSYEVLDRIIQAYLEEEKSAEEIAHEENFSLLFVEEMIKKIHQAEYKRRQASPVLRVSSKALVVGRKVPIVQGWV